MPIEQEKIQKALAILEEKARNKQLICYGELYQMLMLSMPKDQNLGSDILTGVNEITRENNIQLSAIAVSKEQSMPYPGFFKLAIDWGLIKKNASEDEKLIFWATEVKKVFNFYKNTKL
jgi:hypothetical protein